MPGALSRYLSDDHNRLDALLRRAAAKPGVIEMVPYGEFRKGLLRHDELAGSENEMLLGQMMAAPEVPVTPYNERPIVLEATRRAVERAGYTFHNAP